MCKLLNLYQLRDNCKNNLSFIIDKQTNIRCVKQSYASLKKGIRTRNEIFRIYLDSAYIHTILLKITIENKVQKDHRNSSLKFT